MNWNDFILIGPLFDYICRKTTKQVKVHAKDDQMYCWQQVKDNTNLLCSTVRQIPFFSGFPIFSDYIIPEVNKLNINILLQDMNKSFKHLLLNKQEIRFVEPLNRGQYSHLQINVG